MTDDTEDKKTDKVISMKEFLREVEHESSFPTVEDILQLVGEHGTKKVVCVCEDFDGKMGFFTNCSNYMEILFFLEAYKKIILDYTVSQSHE